MKIAIAQLNPTVGALDNNSRKIEEITQEYAPKCDLIVFPEMCLTGYPPQDLLLDTAFIAKTAEALKNIAAKVKETPVILGAIRHVEDKLFNTAAILQHGQTIAFRDKTHLPTYDVFDEDRYFVAAVARKPVTLNIHGKAVKLGIEICEDLWDEDYETKVSRELIHAGAEILINISASPFHLNRLDERLDIISNISKSQRTINASISIVEIAGLVKGASKGEGLGNKFLSHIREVDAITHLTRCFDSNKIQNVNKSVDPIRDIEIVETEMLLADLELIQKRLEKNKKKLLNDIQLKILNDALNCINNDINISTLAKKYDQKNLNQIGLLSVKPKIYVCNVDEKSLVKPNH